MLDQTITRHNPNGAMAGDWADNFERFVQQKLVEVDESMVFEIAEDKRLSQAVRNQWAEARGAVAEAIAQWERDQYGL